MLPVLAPLYGASQTANMEELWERYSQAVQDASIAEPEEISRDLTAIVGYEDGLIWDGTPGESRVLVVTWTSWDGYRDMTGKSVKMNKTILPAPGSKIAGPWDATRDVWVTAAPFLKEFTRKHLTESDDLDMRLRQLLGLPPDDEKYYFVEFWVDPADLFRPSADPEITDHEAELSAPVSSRYITVSESHTQWMQTTQASIYGAPGDPNDRGYPWTRLGYTYDWGNPASEIGLSEFIIREGAAVGVHSFTPTAEYCPLGSTIGKWKKYP